MLFTTLNFIIFFTTIFLLYYLAGNLKIQKFVILFSNFLFYAFTNPFFIGILLAVSFIAYLFALLLIKYSQKLFFILGLVSLLVILIIFKYVPLLNQVYNLFFTPMSFPSIIYPIGLSFYLFQAIGYLTSVYWGRYEAEKSFVNFLLYISFFPQIMQGPIAEYDKLSIQFNKYHEYNYNNAVLGIQRIVWGFFEKLVIANNISRLISGILIDSSSFGGMTTLFAMFLYSFQLYADFAGYTDIALGCSQMLGFKLNENFNSPYLSASITEFWRRWHMSLGNWFREFVFYPLLRSKAMSGLRKSLKKKSKALSKNIPTIISLLIFWFSIGLWHGANFVFILYGLYHGFFVIAELIASETIGIGYSIKRTKLYSLIKIVVTFIIVTFGYVLFVAPNLSISKEIFVNIFTNPRLHDFRRFIGDYQRNLLAIGLSIITLLIVDIVHYLYPNISIRDWIRKRNSFTRYLIYFVALLSVIILGAYGTEGVNEFAYFRF